MGFGITDGLFDIFPILFIIVFLFVFGVMISTVVKNAKTARKNNASPRLTVNAVVAAKRMQVGSHGGANGTRMSYTEYYVTFQVESGDRFELEVDGGDYGMLIEGDSGRLTFQGTRYLGFERS